MHKRATDRVVILSLIALVFMILLAISRAPFSDPRVYVESHATATAIAPAIETTRMYMELIPTVQAMEASERAKTVETEQKNERALNTAYAFVKIAIASSIAILFAANSARLVVEQYKRARSFEPYQVLPDRSLLFPKRERLHDPRSARSAHLLDDTSADREHANAIASVKFRFSDALFSCLSEIAANKAARRLITASKRSPPARLIEHNPGD